MRVILRKIIVVSIYGLILISCKTEKKPVDQNSNLVNTNQEITFRENPELINEFLSSEYHDGLIENASIETVEEMAVTYNGNTLKIYLQHIPDWNDPGDFLKVKIIDQNENILLEQANISGWVKFGNNYTVPEDVKAINQMKSDKALLISNKNGKQLIIFGWAYASTPGLMTIIDLFPKPRIIYNKKFKLIEISDFNENGYRNLVGSTTYTNTMKLNMEKMILE